MNTTLDIDRVLEDYYAWLVRIRDFDPKTIRYQQLALGSFHTFLVERGRPMSRLAPRTPWRGSTIASRKAFGT